MSNDRTLPVTPAERACATVLRAYLLWNTDEANDPEGTTAWWSMVKLGEYLETRCLVEPTGLSATPAGRDLLARVEAAERTPAASERCRSCGGDGHEIDKVGRGGGKDVPPCPSCHGAGTTPLDAPPRREP